MVLQGMAWMCVAGLRDECGWRWCWEHDMAALGSWHGQRPGECHQALLPAPARKGLYPHIYTYFGSLRTEAPTHFWESDIPSFSLALTVDTMLSWYLSKLSFGKPQTDKALTLSKPAVWVFPNFWIILQQRPLRLCHRILLTSQICLKIMLYFWCIFFMCMYGCHLHPAVLFLSMLSITLNRLFKTEFLRGKIFLGSKSAWFNVIISNCIWYIKL